MELRQLASGFTKFKLDSISEDVDFILRPVNLEDEVWISKNFDDIQSVFENLEMDKIARIVYRLLEPASKAFFKSREVVTLDEEGNEEVIKTGGVAMLRSAISGWGNKITICNALTQHIINSRPDIKEEFERQTEKEKEKEEKKN